MNFKMLWLSLFFCCSGLYPLEESSSSYPSKAGIWAIDWYKENISTLNFTKCAFYPTCSQYTKQSIKKYGLLRGWIMGCDRLMRCNHDLWVYKEVMVEGELKKYDPVL